MGVEMRKGRDGKLRSCFYGTYQLDGKRHTINLGVKIEGCPPKSLRDLGDIVFERSRVRAEEKLQEIVDAIRSKKHSQEILSKIYEGKTGCEVPDVPLEELPQRWEEIPRSRSLSKHYIDSAKAILRRFVKFIKERDSKISDLTSVKKSLVLEFLKKEDERQIAAKTYNDIIKLLRGIWNKLLPGFPNPLQNLPARQLDTQYRKPFNETQIAQILEVAQKDTFVYPIVVLALCTAMRKGDCCLLKWNDVDLPSRFISVKTSKTGARVEIPIWPVLYDVLVSLPREGIYVLPEHAELYKRNPDEITVRVKRILREAGILGVEKESHSLKRERFRDDYDFHSFRVTWVTTALASGVPLEIVQRVTGHSTVEVVRKHYFQPDRAAFAAVLANKMPKVFTEKPSTRPSTVEEILALIRSMDAENFQIYKERIINVYSRHQ